MAAFRRNAELYPNSANVYNSLADGYEAAGQMEPAKQNVSKAIERATKANSAQSAEFKRHLDRLTAAKPTN
jgi:tetratricopeptide (TPR) repeat protein